MVRDRFNKVVGMLAHVKVYLHQESKQIKKRSKGEEGARVSQDTSISHSICV